MKTLRVLSILTVFVLIVMSASPVMAAPLRKQPTCTLEQIDDRSSVESALNNDGVKALQDFLSGMGYQGVDSLATVSLVKCEGNKHQATVTIIPFTQDGSTLAAHIAFWDANWNAKGLSGSIAIVEDNQGVVYSYSGKKGVVSGARGNWAKQAGIPFSDIQGFRLPMTTEMESSETIDPQSQPSRGIASAQAAAATSCKTVKAARIGYTLLGFVAYKFWQQKYFCYNGSSAVSNVNVSAYVSNMDPEHYYRGVVSQSDIPLNTGAHDSMRQGQIDNCILKYGCIGSYYPAVEIIAYKDGSWYYTTWQ